MSSARVAPTRLNLIRTERRLERVEKGAALLRRKREALVTELFRLARPAAGARTLIEESARQGYTRLLGGLATVGRTGIQPLGWPERDLRVEIRAAQIWGVPVASIISRPPLVRSVAARTVAPPTGGPTVAAAAGEFERLVEMLLDAATREMLIRRLGEALARASRQVHTLERRLTPDLRQQMARVRRTLEEREREEHLRLKHLRRRRGDRDSGRNAG